MCNLKAGDMVECIFAGKIHQWSKKVMPVEGQRYTVESVRPLGDGYSVRLHELIPHCNDDKPCKCGNCGWDSTRFRKINPPKKELPSVLTDLLLVPDRKVLEPV